MKIHEEYCANIFGETDCLTFKTLNEALACLQGETRPITIEKTVLAKTIVATYNMGESLPVVENNMVFSREDKVKVNIKGNNVHSNTNVLA